jgi:hypothetical protein
MSSSASPAAAAKVVIRLGNQVAEHDGGHHHFVEVDAFRRKGHLAGYATISGRKNCRTACAVTFSLDTGALFGHITFVPGVGFHGKIVKALGAYRGWSGSVSSGDGANFTIRRS